MNQYKGVTNNMNGQSKDVLRLAATIVVIVASLFLSKEQSEVPEGVIEAVAGVLAYLLGVFSNNLPSNEE